jgi:hypothetical protein
MAGKNRKLAININLSKRKSIVFQNTSACPDKKKADRLRISVSLGKGKLPLASNHTQQFVGSFCVFHKKIPGDVTIQLSGVTESQDQRSISHIPHDNNCTLRQKRMNNTYNLFSEGIEEMC